MVRRSLASTVVAVVAALSACGGGSSEVTPTPSVTVVTSADTTAATVAPSVAPSVASAPTTGATTTASATTVAPATVAPRRGLVTLTESPMATRRESTTEGVMVKASNPAFDRSFVLTMFASDFARALPSPGWTLAPIARDPQWTPSGCGGATRAFVGRRWEVYFDLATRANGPDPARAQLVAFDTRTGAMTGYLEQPNQVGWLTSTLHAYDDHTVGMLFDPDGPVDAAGLQPMGRLALRRLDLVTGRATDIEMPEMPADGAFGAWIDPDGNVLVFGRAAQATQKQTLHRWVPGHAPVRLVEPPVYGAETVDGVRLDARAQDANGDWPVVDASDTVLARIHAWRFAADGPGIGVIGWSRGRGYFGAFHDEPTGDASTYLSPGVYDAGTAAWSWVFAPTADLTHPISFFLVGTT